MKTLLGKFAACAAALKLVSSAALAAAGWSDDYEKALAQAKAEKKIVLLDFTGSDWCPWCIKLDKEVYEKPKFKDYAKDNLVLVTVDFPNGKHLAKKVKDQNDKLKQEFKVEGFPTTVLLDGDGKKLGEFSGYVEGGPDVFISKIEALKKK